MSRVRWWHVLASEVLKLTTLRSVWITALVTVGVPVAMGALSAPGIGDAIANDPSALAEGTTPEVVGLELLALGQAGAIVIGVVAGTSEHTSGQIKTSLAAVPRRGVLMATKVVALVLVVLATALVAVPAVSLVSQAGMGPVGVLDDGVPGSLVLRWVGGVVYWVGMALIAFAAGVLLRQTLVPLFVLLLVSQLSLLLVLLTSWSRWLPTVAGIQLFDPGQVSGAFPEAGLAPAAAGTCFALWVAGCLLVAALVFRRRDVRA